jgi:hypothetical protein
MSDTPWEESVGSIPYKVTVFEMATRKGVLYLRWRADGNWKVESLAPAAAAAGFDTATLFDSYGRRLKPRFLKERQQWAIDQAEAKFAKLRAGLTDEVKEAAPLALKDTWAVIADEKTGKYPSRTAHRDEVERELNHAIRVLCDRDRPNLTWAALKRADVRKLWRTRIRELRAAKHDGLRGAEITVARLLAIYGWLSDEEHIHVAGRLVSRKWKAELREDWLLLAKEDRLPEPKRPRFTADEFRRLLPATWDVDPRLGLMYALGAELRGGQIVRGRRSDLTLPRLSKTSEDFGEFRVPGMGKKGGTVIDLTRGQRQAVDRALDAEFGYLRELEAAYRAGKIKDYYLFPAGQLPGLRLYRDDPSGETAPTATVERHTARYASRTAIAKWFKLAQTAAGVRHQKGRLWYGGRRINVDLAKEVGISREGLQESGGWSDSQVPDSIYADKQRKYARREARDVRARTRREK